MATGVQLDTMLVRTPEVCGGRLRIDGTRVSVLQIVTLYKHGETPEEIAENFPQVKLEQVFAALAYYHANRTLVEQELAAEADYYDRLKAQHSPSATPP